MVRADALIALVKAGCHGDQPTFRRALEAIIADERAGQHLILAERLSEYLKQTQQSNNGFSTTGSRDSHNSALWYEQIPRRPLSDLILPLEVELACKELIEEQYRADILRSYNLEPRNRILLAGPPGNGKTSLAEAIAYELAVPLIVARYEGLIASYLGETAVRLAKLFEQVSSRRCVLFFDEFDVIGKERADVHETGEIKRVVSSLLLHADVLPSYVVVITATNHPELLDRAVWRRFQLRLHLPAPSEAMVVEWFTQFQSRFDHDLGKSPLALSRILKGLSFSEIEQFTFDIQRRFVLGLPNEDAKSITRSVLTQWKKRYTLSAS